MNIEILLSRDRAWRWTHRLANALRCSGHTVVVTFPDGARDKIDPGLAALEWIEKVLLGLRGERASDRLAVACFDEFRISPGFVADATLDLAGSTGWGRPAKGVVLTPIYDGSPMEEAAYDALLQETAPRIAVVNGQNWEMVGGAVSVSDFSSVSRGVDQVFARMQDLCRQALSRLSFGETMTKSPEMPDGDCSPSPVRLAIFLASSVASKVAGRIRRLVSLDYHWAMGWRQKGATRLLDRLDPGAGSFNVIADDRKRFFADPFPISADGRCFLFCEEYLYATGKGVISVMELFPDGSNSQARVVIEQPYHLSYPHVFERDGTFWMIPETSANGTVELWRAVSFPWVWEKETVLIDGVTAVDATFLETQAGLWLFAGLAVEESNGCEALGVWHGQSLLGPWRPLGDNPVLIDASAARPAGRFHLVSGELFRPTQDCSHHYGGAVTLCRVDELLPERAFRQTKVARLAPPPGYFGFHTVNETDDVEAVDFCGRVAKRSTSLRTICFETEGKGARA